MTKRFFFSFYLFCAIFSFAAEYTVESIPNPKTADAESFVSNPDGILNRQTVSRMNETLRSLEADTGAEVAVVAVNSIGSNDVKDFAVQLFVKWGIGKAEADNGLLILFVLDQRTITFETGYGLEGILPDVLCSRIQNENMFSAFKKEDYDAGFISGINRIASILREEPVDVLKKEKGWNIAIPISILVYLLFVFFSFFWVNATGKDVAKKYSIPETRYSLFISQKQTIINTMAFTIPLVLFFIGLIVLPTKYLLLFIPMPFMAIPANIFGNRLAWKIRTTIPCDACDGVMCLLPEKEKDKYLTPAQQFEKQIGSVNFAIFKCGKCDNVQVFKSDKRSRYSVCPNCGIKAFFLIEREVVVQPTYQRTGEEQVVCKCKYCGYEEHKKNILPRKEEEEEVEHFVSRRMTTGSTLSNSSSNSSSSTNSRTKGGSFGGGRSGGGGATGSW